MSKFEKIPEARPLRLIVCGHEKSGKSSIINALMRGSTLASKNGLPLATKAVRRGTHETEFELQDFKVIELLTSRDVEARGQALDLMATADVLVWVTSATSAWQETEKSVFQLLPEELPQRSIIAVSRADKLKNALDWDKIHTRLIHEAGSYFREAVFFSASKNAIGASKYCEEVWQLTGGYLLSKILEEFAVDQSTQTEVPSNILTFPAA